MAKKNKSSEFKPRSEHLNDVLMSRPAGRMKDKSVPSRSKDKENLKQGRWDHVS